MSVCPVSESLVKYVPRVMLFGFCDCCLLNDTDCGFCVKSFGFDYCCLHREYMEPLPFGARI